MVTTNFWASTFVPWEADWDIQYWGAIDVHWAESVVLEHNMVAGAERIGINLIGDICPGVVGDTLGRNNYSHSIRNNTVYSAMIGVSTQPTYLYPQDNATITCGYIRNFTIFKSTYWGIYFNSPYGFMADSNTLVDNRVGIFTMIIEPSPLTHELARKPNAIANSLIVARSSTYNCSTDIVPDDLNYAKALTARPIGSNPNRTGRVGIAWPSFMGSTNGAPFKPWYHIRRQSSSTFFLLGSNHFFI